MHYFKSIEENRNNILILPHLVVFFEQQIKIQSNFEMTLSELRMEYS